MNRSKIGDIGAKTAHMKQSTDTPFKKQELVCVIEQASLVGRLQESSATIYVYVQKRARGQIRQRN
jgi:hypothetical protein